VTTQLNSAATSAAVNCCAKASPQGFFLAGAPGDLLQGALDLAANDFPDFLAQQVQWPPSSAGALAGLVCAIAQRQNSLNPLQSQGRRIGMRTSANTAMMFNARAMATA